MKKKIKIYTGVVIGLLLISLVLSLTSLSILESLRIVFGGLFVLFLPGYVITELFLEREDVIETIALSFALSIAIVPLTVFYLNKVGMKITTISSIISIALIIALAFMIRHRGKLYNILV